MSSTPEDVKVRLSPEGVQEIVNALKKIENEANKAGRSSANAFKKVATTTLDLRRTLTTLGIVGAVTGIIAFVKSTREMADESGKAAARLGTTSESISTLRFQAKLSNVENQQLEQGLINLTDSLGELEKGTKSQTNAFKRLGLTNKDFNGLDTAEAFDLIAKKVDKFGDSASKTRAIIDIFGKRVGPQLIPLLNDLGEKGFAVARKEAERFGLVIDSQTAAAADQVGDAFDLMGAQTRGLALQFLSGLAPAVATVMEDFREDVAGVGVTAAQEFGQKTGQALRNVVGFFQVAGDKIGELIAKWRIEQDRLGAVNLALKNRDAAGVAAANKLAEEQLKALEEQRDERMEALATERAASEERARQLGVEAAKRAEARKALADQLKILEAQEAATEKKKKDMDAFDDLQEAVNKREQDYLDRVQKTRELLNEMNKDVLANTGKERDAKIAALDEELAKNRMVFAEAGKLSAEVEAKLQQVRQVKITGIDFEETRKGAEQALDAFNRDAAQIQRDQEAGVITQLEGENRLIALQRNRLTVLKELAAQTLIAARATGSKEAIAEAEQFAASVDTINASFLAASEASGKFRQGFESGLQSGLTALLTNIDQVKSLGDAFKSLARTVAQAMAQIAAEILAKAAVLAILKSFGGAPVPAAASTGGQVHAASGGHIRGAGTATSDSIPAWLSDGEFVVRSAVVKQPGVLEMLHALNRSARAPRIGARRFKDGGLVTPGKSPAERGIKVVNVLDDSLVHDAMGTPAGEKVIMNVIERNPGRISRMVRG